MELAFLLLLLPVAHAVTHSLTYFVTLSTGFQDASGFVAVSMMDGVPLAYCYSGHRTEERVGWLKKLAADNPKLSDWNEHICGLKFNNSKSLLEEIQLRSNQTGGAHVLQEVSGCELDTDTKATTLYDTFAYDGEDFMTLDKKTWTWNYTQKASIVTQNGGRLHSEPDYVSDTYLDLCPEMLKKYLKYWNSSVLSQDPPSVSLLQASPSSPVSCHATGFYPNRPKMFWRRDRWPIHEDGDEGEILPNHDGTFQMSVDLNVSSIRAEDWRRYDCVFQLYGFDDIITKLDSAAIRTSDEKLSETNIAVITLVVVVVLGLVAAAGFRLYKKEAPDSGSELYERLTTEL